MHKKVPIPCATTAAPRAAAAILHAATAVLHTTVAAVLCAAATAVLCATVAAVLHAAAAATPCATTATAPWPSLLVVGCRYGQSGRGRWSAWASVVVAVGGRSWSVHRRGDTNSPIGRGRIAIFAKHAHWARVGACDIEQHAPHPGVKDVFNLGAKHAVQASSGSLEHAAVVRDAECHIGLDHLHSLLV